MYMKVTKLGSIDKNSPTIFFLKRVENFVAKEEIAPLIKQLQSLKHVLVDWGLTPFSIIFQSYHGGQFTL